MRWKDSRRGPNMSSSRVKFRLSWLRVPYARFLRLASVSYLTTTFSRWMSTERCLNCLSMFASTGRSRAMLRPYSAASSSSSSSFARGSLHGPSESTYRRTSSRASWSARRRRSATGGVLSMARFTAP